MHTRSSRANSIARYLAALSVLAIAGVACSRVDEHIEPAASSTAGPGDHVCPIFVTDRWVDVPTKSADEPRLRIPQPAGWEPVEGVDNSEMRLVLRNERLVVGNHAPTITVLMESPVPVTTADQLLRSEVQNLKDEGFTDVAEAPVDVCGYAATKVTFVDPPPSPEGTIPARPSTAVIAAPEFNGHLWGTGVLIQAINPEDPTFTADLNTVLKGFQILPPAAEPGKAGKNR